MKDLTFQARRNCQCGLLLLYHLTPSLGNMRCDHLTALSPQNCGNRNRERAQGEQDIEVLFKDSSLPSLFCLPKKKVSLNGFCCVQFVMSPGIAYYSDLAQLRVLPKGFGAISSLLIYKFSLFYFPPTCSV